MHYHGTPITPKAVLETLSGRNFCVSFAAPGQVADCHRIGQSVMLDLFQLSRWTSNATLYYETSGWGARISSAYRSGYLDSAGGNGSIGAGYLASNNIDLAAHYNTTGGLRIVLEGVNLTDEPITQYSDITEKRLTARTFSGRTFTLGVTYEF